MNTQPLTTEEQERAAYLAGDTRTAELFDRIAELEAELEKVKYEAADDSLARWENENGDADQYKEFFFDSFARLAGHYPAPSVSSDYDKYMIFAAIKKGEGVQNETI